MRCNSVRKLWQGGAVVGLQGPEQGDRWDSTMLGRLHTKRQEVADWRMVRAGMPAQFRTMGAVVGGLLDWNRVKRPRGEELEDQERPRKQTRSVSQREPD